MTIDINNRPFLLGCSRPRPQISLNTACRAGDPVTISLGSKEAWAGTLELRERVIQAIQKDEVRRLGDLVSTNREAVLRMPEIHDYLGRLRRKGHRTRWNRIMGIGGVRGRPRVDNVGIVLRVDKCMDEFGLGSVAKAAERLRGVLHLSPGSIANRYSRYEPLVRTMLAGYASEAGTMTEDSYSVLFNRPG